MTLIFRRRWWALALGAAMVGAIMWFGAAAFAQATGTLDVQIVSGTDDAEENPFGGVSTISTDLDMVFDRFGSLRDNEAIGLRFTGIAIPPNARITNAYVEFRVDEVSDVPTFLTLHGEASDDAATFTPCAFSCFDLTSRPTTQAAADWFPDPWVATFTFERTTDISGIVQEIVNRPNWVSGNALVVLITGEGERTADSYEGGGSLGLGAPRLHVEWENPGHVELLKLTDGVENQTMAWNFTLTGPGVDESDSSPPTTVDFGGANLRPGDEYTLCETGIPSGWTLEWQVDTNRDGVPDTIIPIVAGVNNDPVDPTLGYSRVYDPNFDPNNSNSNDTRCVNFVVDPDETLAFQIDNRRPGGEPRTIGFWKNWNDCTNGNQAQTAADNGGPGEGWFILDDLLNAPGYTVGGLQLAGSDCEAAVDLLDKRDIESGRKRANDGAFKLAAQLLAAQLNLSASAETCQDVVDAVNDGQALLAGIGFDGTGTYLRSRDGQPYDDAVALAGTLDTYNQGGLCN